VKVRLASGEVKTYLYHRKTGKRLTGAPGTREFQASYDEAGGRDIVVEANFASLLARYYGSPEFSSLKERTRADYRKHRKIIEAQWADTPLKLFDDRRMRGDLKEWQQALIAKHKERQADLVLATMRRILSYGVDCSLLAHNHAIGLRMAYTADRSDAIWTAHDIAAFMLVAGSQMKLALILALHLGRREADLLALQWSDYDPKAGTIMVTDQKRGRKKRFPAKCTATLRAALDAARAARGITYIGGHILTTAKGQPWASNHFSTKFSATKNKAGLNHLHFHDLRGTAVTVLAENGASNAQIASITGHSMKTVERILDVYMARTAALNESAVAKMEESWIAQIGVIE
jgi:integrase